MSEQSGKPSPPDSPASLAERLARCDRTILEAVQERASLLSQSPPEANPAADWGRLCEGLAISPDTAAVLLREIHRWSRRGGQPLRVAYLGPEDSYSHLAAVEQFGEACDLIPVASIAAVFEEVAAGHCQFGVAPLENSTDGRVVDTLDMFVRVPLKICAEVPLPIRHCLLGSGQRSDVRRVLSKPQALSQCRQWLSRHMPQAALGETGSTSEAAAAAAQDPAVAAIASRTAAGRYGLSILAENIQDSPRNVTRFAVLGDQAAPATGRDKTALLFQVRHQPGALVEAMLLFQQQGLNMTWIESFPCRDTPQEYLFFVELQGHHEDPAMQRALQALRGRALRLDILGSYAAAIA